LLENIAQKEKEIENKIDEKIESITEEEAKELLLDKFFELISNQVEQYLNAEKKELIKIFEKLWDKYKVSLQDLKAERDEEIKKLEEFLQRLGYCYE